MAYHTKHKEHIFALFERNKEAHFNAYGVWQHLQDAGHPISLATVYRQLEQLTGEGKLKQFQLGTGKRSACYQYIGTAQRYTYHLKCVVCGALSHISCNHLVVVEEHILEEHAFALDLGRSIFYGTCEYCKKGRAYAKQHS